MIHKSAYYQAKYEKKKIVKVLRTSKKSVWFEHETGRYVYDYNKFINDFILKENN